MKTEKEKPKKYIAVDLDGTLALDDTNDFLPDYIGEPVPIMLAQVKKWLEEDREVRIMTACVCSDFEVEDRIRQRVLIQDWCMKHLGRLLPITAEKGSQLGELWDDRAVQVIKNTGVRVGDHHRL